MHSEKVILQSLQCMSESGLPCLLMVTHALGGGVERHVQELQAVLKNRAHVVIVRPHVHAQQILFTAPLYVMIDGALQAHDVVNLAFKWPQDSAQMGEWISLFGISRVHVHHVLGFPKTFWTYLLKFQLPLDLTLHDHSIFTGNPSLLDEQGRFDPSWLDEGLSAMPTGDAQVAWAFRKLALRAHRVIVPSQALAAAVRKVFPSLDVLVRNHPEREIDGRYPRIQQYDSSPSKPFKVLCLGMLGIEKGAYALARTAALAVQQQLDIEFVLLGACHVVLPSSVRCMGLYQDTELPDLIAEIAPHLLWLPAQCPETWSYTLSAGLRAGLPVLASALGALPERLDGRPFTRLIAHTATAEQWLTTIQQMQEQISAEHDPQDFEWPQSYCEYFYTDAVIAREGQVLSVLSLCYLQSVCARVGKIEILPTGFMSAQRLALQRAGRWRVLLLRTIYIVSRWSLVARLVRYVPYHWQRRLKRAISRAPLDSRTLRK